MSATATAEIVMLPPAQPEPIDRQTFVSRVVSFAGRGREVEALRFAAELWGAVGG